MPNALIRKLEGFAPLDVVRMRFKEEIKNEVLQLVLPDQVTAAIQEHDLHPLTEPHLHVDDVENIKVNGSVFFLYGLRGQTEVNQNDLSLKLAFIPNIGRS